MFGFRSSTPSFRDLRERVASQVRLIAILDGDIAVLKDRVDKLEDSTDPPECPGRRIRHRRGGYYCQDCRP